MHIDLPKTGMVTLKECAAGTKSHQQTWRNWLAQGEFPGAVKIGPVPKPGAKDTRIIRIPAAEAWKMIEAMTP